jgi:hypothetical protein
MRERPRLPGPLSVRAAGQALSFFTEHRAAADLVGLRSAPRSCSPTATFLTQAFSEKKGPRLVRRGPVLACENSVGYGVFDCTPLLIVRSEFSLWQVLVTFLIPEFVLVNSTSQERLCCVVLTATVVFVVFTVTGEA